jgi:hypothetical protein
MSENTPVYVCNAPAIPCADLALPADLLSHIEDLLDLVQCSDNSRMYLEHAIDLLKLVEKQFNRWTPREDM